MYKLHLILKYLRRRRIAWVSLIAVMLCTTMVTVVISVMGGWLDMFENSARGLTGDVVITSRSMSGFPYYQEIIDAIKADPNAQVAAAVPTIETYALLNINGIRTTPARVWGIPIEQIGEVNVFPTSLYQQYTKPMEQGKSPGKPTFDLHDSTLVELEELPEGVDIRDRNDGKIGPAGDADWDRIRYQFFRLEFHGKMTDAIRDKYLAASSEKKWKSAINRLANESNWPGLIAGAPVLDIRKSRSGQIEGRDPEKYRLWAKLTMLSIPNDQQLSIENKTEAQFWIVDDSRTGMWQYDNDHVYVPFSVLQEKLGMGEGPATYLSHVIDSRDDTGAPLITTAPVDGAYFLQRFTEREPDPSGKVTLKRGQSLGFRKDPAGKVVAFAGDKTVDLGAGQPGAVWRVERLVPGRATDLHVKLKDGATPLAARDEIEKIVADVMDRHRNEIWAPRQLPSVRTWKQVNELFIGAIEHEKLLVVFLFGIISIVAIFLIFCIFYMIVAEKTKDIGIIKSVGATNSGVAAIFLGYGLTIGIVGAGMGLLVSYLIVHNINQIHDWIGARLGVVIWNPEVYAFDTIPNKLQPMSTVIIIAVAIVASVLGALVPAIRAAQLHPVEALRWE